jgi:hypothetical protein
MIVITSKSTGRVIAMIGSFARAAEYARKHDARLGVADAVVHGLPGQGTAT